MIVNKKSKGEVLDKSNSEAGADSCGYQEEGKEIKLSKEEEEEAKSLLRQDDLLDRFLDEIEYIGCVGEDENKIFLYMGATSRKLDGPLGIILKAESSAGKSFLVSSVLSFIPDDEILEFTAMTSKALLHRKDDIRHKILYVHERAGAEQADYSVRVLQSEKKIILSIPVKEPGTDIFVTREFKVEGPVAWFETTTSLRVHPENETRLFAIFIDESEEQTRRIHQIQNRKYDIRNPNKEGVPTVWKNAQKLLEPISVTIPYVDSINFPTKPLRVRRDKPRFLTLIEVSAFLFQHQRARVTEGGREYVVADIEDYTLAHSLVGKILESVLKGLSPKIKELIDVAQNIEGKDFTNKDVAKRLRWSRQTLTKYIKEAVSLGYFEIKESGGHGKPYRYEVIRPEEVLTGLRSPEEMAFEMQRMSKVPLDISSP